MVAEEKVAAFEQVIYRRAKLACDRVEKSCKQNDFILSQYYYGQLMALKELLADISYIDPFVNLRKILNELDFKAFSCLSGGTKSE